MFRVDIDSVGDFKRLLGTTVNSSVTFKIKDKHLTLLVASTEVIVMYKVKNLVDVDDCSFSVNRESLNRLYRSGSFSVDIVDSIVTIYFYDVNNRLTHSADFPYIQDIESLYAGMLGLLTTGQGTEIDLRGILPMARLAISQQSSLQVRDNVASVIVNSNLKIFKPVKADVDFNLRFTHLRLLMNNSVSWYKVQQYICAKCENLMYICATDRLNDCDGEYQMVHGGYNLAIKMRMMLQLQPLRDLANSHFQFDNMKLDLDTRSLQLDGNIKCKIYLEITDLQKTSDFKTDTLLLPKNLLGILGIFGDKVMITHRKSFLCMSDTNGVEVYFN